ncbi:class A beta-lactamase-related serine hydrolase [Sphingomonas gei]|uniref:Class A beta-lactamase-related serine hydrolase n=1 Tax=Sphingomonas gei TaxID=1395960 RepID=A0A4S1X1U2_9SPHN|nr:serine hydrolase domain-containing protein [Sphingomonas gei]TGX48740.1 class A beta-lactamase-related serine hydrolase [Sphingomonas gei]
MTMMLLGALAAVGAHANAPAPPQSLTSPAVLPRGVAPAAVPAGTGALTKTDADAWLDGFVPYMLGRDDIAGAVVVIVKDGQVLTRRGYGYADIASRRKVDPETTLFRVGSTSKLFTWTAVMQLVERGKIDLDADVNRYIDFRIPEFRGQPITMRHLLTHTPGFEEVYKGGFSYSGTVTPLGSVVKQLLPERVFAPGTTPAYSNYGTALAGYIVERVSGVPFETYIERNIFRPLGMSHSSFRQPLPPALRPLMATGYPLASGEPKPFELISVPPAGSLSMTGADGARFMISHLNRAAGLLRPATAALMHTPANGAIPGLNRMALGFYEQRVNDTYSIGHGGDLINFHGDLWLFPEHNVGLMIEMNSAGKDGATASIRAALFEQFADRYFPKANDAAPVELPTAKVHAAMLAGSYFNSRAEFTTFLDIGNFLGQYRIGLDQDGRPLVPDISGGPPRKWIEVAPFVWQDAHGHARLGAVAENGRIVRWSVNQISPFMVFDRVPWHRDAAWLMPLLLVSLAITAIAALSWPAGAITRRRYGAPLALPRRDRTARRLALLLSWLALASFLAWALVLSLVVEALGTADWPIWASRILGDIAFVGLPIAAAWNAVRTWQRGSPWPDKAFSILLVAAALIILWVAASFHLLGLSSRF